MSNGIHANFEPLMTDLRAETAYVHESSYVDVPCRIGEHTAVLHFSHIMAHTIIGDHCFIGRNVTIASGVMLGNNVRVMNNAQLNSGVIMEDEVYCGPSVIFAENRHVRAVPKNISRISPTLVRQGAQLGPHATVASGFIIGRFAFIEAGTIVDRNIPDFAIACGDPLKLAGWRCECGRALPIPGFAQEATVSCSACGKRYLRQARWKIVQLTDGESSLDTDSQFNPTIRRTQNRD